MPIKRNRVPNIVKHTTLAIYGKGGIDGGTSKERFRSAWNIARSRLVEYGFLMKGSEKGPHGVIRLTAKGRKRNQEHKSERGVAIKSMNFDKMFEWIRHDEEEGKDGEQK
jgi:hypothetical protein